MRNEISCIPNCDVCFSTDRLGFCSDFSQSIGYEHSSWLQTEHTQKNLSDICFYSICSLNILVLSQMEAHIILFNSELCNNNKKCRRKQRKQSENIHYHTMDSSFFLSCLFFPKFLSTVLFSIALIVEMRQWKMNKKTTHHSISQLTFERARKFASVFFL